MLINSLLGIAGLELRKIQMPRSSLMNVLLHLKKMGVMPASVIDVGAAFGGWTQRCFEIYPDAQYLLIEPLEEYRPALEKIKQRIQHANIESCLAGSQNQKAPIFVHADLVGSSMKEEMEHHNQRNCTERMLETKTLDHITKEHCALPPYLMKLDIQGTELEALEGAKNTLHQSAAVILEVSLMNVFSNGYELAEVTRQMKKDGFVAYDIFGLNYRLYDNALSQIDIVFVPEGSLLRTTRWYANETQRKQMDEKFIQNLKEFGVWIQKSR